MRTDQDIPEVTGEQLESQTNLTRSQFLIWMGQKLNPDAPLYNMIQTFAFDGRLDPALFARAFQTLVDRSDSLRTIIEEKAGVPRQQVLSRLSYQVELVDFSAAADPQQAYDAWLVARRRHLFDLGRRLFDTALIRLGLDRYIWYLNQHHLITDGWSFVVVYRQMSAIYEALRDGRDPAGLTPLPAFRDYIAYERDHRQTSSYEEAQRYWAEKLANPAEPLQFYDRPPAQLTARTERRVCDLGRERTEKLKALARRKGVQTFSQDLSLYNIFAAAFVSYLNRVSGSSAIALGTPFHNRPTAPFKETIGLFIEIGPLHVRIAENETFLSLIQKMMGESFAAMRQAQPGISSAETNRSYQVLLNFVNVTFPAFAGLPVAVDWVHAGYGDSHHALRLQVHDFSGSGSYKLHFDFNTHVFTPAQRELAIRHFLMVLDALLEDVARPLAGVSLLAPDEEARLVSRFNRTAAPYPADQSITALFEAQVARTPDAPAVAEGARQLTYRQLNERANRLARRLQALGVGPGRLVAILMDHSPDVVAALLAVLKAGGAYVPIDPAYPPERIAFLLADLAAAQGGDLPVVLTEPRLVDQLPAAVGPVLALAADWRDLSGEAADDWPTRPAPADPAYVIYTSGSTGQPKGVVISQRSLVNYIWWAKNHYLQGEIYDFPLFSSLSFDLTVTSIFVPLISGGRIVVYPEDPGVRGLSILKVIADDQVDLVKLTPAHLNLIRSLDLGRTRIKGFIVGGEDFKRELAQAIVDRFDGRIAIYNEYGPTEATVGCMIHRYDPAVDQGTSVPIGRPVANARIYVLDPQLNPVGVGVTGEMAIGGDGLALGYLNRPELTAERFIDHPLDPGRRLYRTGDLARWGEDGRLEFLGRADHQVKVGGARIELGEIEARLLAHPAVKEAVVDVVAVRRQQPASELTYCTRCGLASSYPGLTFDEAGVCHICRDYDGYVDRAQAYFKTMDEFDLIVRKIVETSTGSHDCVVLLSGGKDSTYMLYRLAAAGLKILAFTLDNGFISDEAKENIGRVVRSLGVDHVFGTTPAMNQIFVESLQQFSNVCNGCFKTIYTLAVNLARERGIKTIVTGLSRGQFFETRLTASVFQGDQFDPERIDQAVLAARKAYHRRSDAVSLALDVDVFRTDAVFEDIQFVDFYRYCDVELEEVYAFLDEHAPWIRPSDTGRSTNCLINDAGIYLHKKQRGFHNYALPYSWDVRLGHKKRDEALEELDDEIDETRVREMLAEIGYEEPPAAAGEDERRLAAYFVADRPLSAGELRDFLARELPDFMLPTYFVALEQMPLTRNGKIDRGALPNAQQGRPELATAYQPPVSPVETRLAEIWSAALNISQIGLRDNFFELGGSSLPAIQIVYQAGQAFQIELPLQRFFENPTVAGMAELVEEIIITEIENMSDEDAERLLSRL